MHRAGVSLRTRIAFTALPLGGALFFFAAQLCGQTDLSTVRGTVVDQSGAVVPNAHVVLLNTDTSVSRNAGTSQSGDYEIPYLVPGTYQLTATAEGFKKFIADRIIVRSRETRRIDVALELGTLGSEVTVTAGAAVIATEGSQIAGGFSRDKFIDSPLSQSTYPQAYMTTLPGVQTPAGDWGLHISGQSSAQSTQDMDGVTNDGNHNATNDMFTFEDLQVVGVNNSAEFSRVVQVSMTSKGGTNEFHGFAFYDLNNSALNARGYFDPSKASYRQHGGSFGVHGPIIRNKTFFFVGGSPVRIPSGTFYNRNVPTMAMRSGDFSQGTTAIKDPLAGQPFPGKVIPLSRQNPTSLKIQDLYIPEPNSGSVNSTFQNYRFFHPWASDIYKRDQVTIRIDHNFSNKNTIYGRYMNRYTPYVLAGSFPKVGTRTRSRKNHHVAVSDTHVFSPAVINTFRWGWIKDWYIDGEPENGYVPVKADTAIKAIGLQGVNAAGYSVMGFPAISITGIQSLTSEIGGVGLDDLNQEFADSVTWSTGRHVFKFGGELRTFVDRGPTKVTAATFGSFNFSSSFTGVGYGDFLLGIPFTSQRDDPLIGRRRSAYELGLFVTDTFKVTRRLSLDLGLRWDYFGATRYADGLMYNWDPATGSVIVPEAARKAISPLYSPDINIVTGEVVARPTKRNIRPRIGVAYRLRDDLVLRGGYGAFTEALGNMHRAQGTGPFRIAETYTNSISGGQSLFAFPNPFPVSIADARVPSQSVSGYPATTTNGVIHQFNLTLEKQFGSLGTRLSYIGSRSRGLNYTLGLNKPQPSLIPFTQSRRPWPQFVGASFVKQDGRENYDSLQFEVQRKVGNLIFDAHYTLANDMADYLNLENPYDYKFWNRDQYTARNRAVVNVAYELPVGHGKRFLASMPAVLDHVLGGWQASWVSYFQSGQYFTPSFSGADPSNTNTVGGRPDRIADGNFAPSQRDRNRWFDASAFTRPPSGRFGNAGVNILQGPGLNLHDLSLTKRFGILGERLGLVYQAIITDLFNTPHFAFPSANISVPDEVGRVSSLLDGRELSGYRRIRMRLRVEF